MVLLNISHFELGGSLVFMLKMHWLCKSRYSSERKENYTSAPRVEVGHLHWGVCSLSLLVLLFSPNSALLLAFASVYNESDVTDDSCHVKFNKQTVSVFR